MLGQAEANRTPNVPSRLVRHCRGTQRSLRESQSCAGTPASPAAQSVLFIGATAAVSVGNGPRPPDSVERYDRVRFRFTWQPEQCRHCLTARAADQKGRTQPDTVPFNPVGCLFNATCKHPVAVLRRKIEMRDDGKPAAAIGDGAPDGRRTGGSRSASLERRKIHENYQNQRVSGRCPHQTGDHLP